MFGEMDSPGRLPNSNMNYGARVETGYHMVKGPADKFPKVVFCDMSLLPGKVGFERVYGSPGNLKPFAAFDVSLR